MAPINLNESRQTVTDGDLRMLQMVTVGMMSGVTGFLAVVLIVAGTAAPASLLPGDEQTVNILSLLHVVVAGLCYALVGPVSARLLRPQPAGGDDSGDGFPVGRLRPAMIVRLALMEAPAFVGLAVCLIGGITGLLQGRPVYWLNLVSAAVFLTYALMTFPTRTRIDYLVSSRAADIGRSV